MLIKIRIKISKFLLLSGWQHLHLYLEENDPPYTLSEFIVAASLSISALIDS